MAKKAVQVAEGQAREAQAVMLRALESEAYAIGVEWKAGKRSSEFSSFDAAEMLLRIAKRIRSETGPV